MSPYVALAVLCDRVAQDPDGPLNIVRIVDTFVAETADGALTGPIAVTGVLSLKSGDAVGSSEVRLRLRAPTRIIEFGNDLRWIVRFAGYHHGVTIPFRLELSDPEEGLFWVDVLCDNERLTSIPMTVRRAPMPASESRQ